MNSVCILQKHDICMPEQALGWLLLRLGLVMKDEPSELSCTLKELIFLKDKQHAFNIIASMICFQLKCIVPRAYRSP